MIWIQNAKAGDRVVCVDGLDGDCPWTGGWAPKTNSIYTIRGIWNDGKKNLLLLKEYVHPRTWDGVNEYGWDASRFRPVHPRKTDIAWAYELLRSAPADQPVKEEA